MFGVLMDDILFMNIIFWVNFLHTVTIWSLLIMYLQMSLESIRLKSQAKKYISWMETL